MLKTPRIYVGATRQNDGKTITCLGLVKALEKRVESVGYIKPVGQRYIDVGGQRIDEDALLMEEVFGIEGELQDMSPVAIPRHFTENYIDNPNPEEIHEAIRVAFERIASLNDLVVIEGTGHAGVGWVFDTPNAKVASLLRSKAILVSSGGIGRPIDEIMLNKATFDREGVPVIGAIINKVEEDKFEKVKSYVTRGLNRLGLEVLGFMPYRPALSSPTLEQLMEDVDGEVLSGGSRMHNTVGKMVIGAMPAPQALEYLNNDSLLITPGTREDLLLAATSSCLLDHPSKISVAGMILTGGTPPQKNVLELIVKADIPAILVKDDTYTVASRISKLIIKIRPEDTEKILAAEEMVEQYVDIDRILSLAQPVSG